jgi:uncharacterized damage-inducible protein DinB
MLTWMRKTITGTIAKLKRQELDFLIDDKANTIGALAMHLAATEVFYGLHTFHGMEWGKFPAADLEKWDVAMKLGEPARKTIKGHDAAYYLAALAEARGRTLAELKKRDDAWLFAIDPKFFGGQPTNNYAKWFHVVEHEANHRGQIRWIAKRFPGAKGGGD